MSPISTKRFWPVFTVESDVSSVSGVSDDELHTLQEQSKADSRLHTYYVSLGKSPRLIPGNSRRQWQKPDEVDIMDLPQEPVYRGLLALLQDRNIPAGSCELSLHAFPFKSHGTSDRHSCQWNGICSSLLPAPHLTYITELIGLWPVKIESNGIWDSFRTSNFSEPRLGN